MELYPNHRCMLPRRGEGHFTVISIVAGLEKSTPPTCRYSLLSHWPPHSQRHQENHVEVWSCMGCVRREFLPTAHKLQL